MDGEFYTKMKQFAETEGRTISGLVKKSVREFMTHQGESNGQD